MDEVVPMFVFCMRPSTLQLQRCVFDSILHSKQCDRQLQMMPVHFLCMRLFAVIQHPLSHAYSSCEVLLSLSP